MTKILGDLEVVENYNLSSIAGLSNITELNQNRVIEDNPALPTCEATNLRAQIEAGGGIGGEITIDGNDNGGDCD